MRRLPGVGGTLFPSRYLSDRLAVDAGISADGREVDACRRRLTAWWRRVEATCGPATGLRTLFDLVCMPLFGALGYRAHDATWRDGRVDARLHTAGGVRVGLTLLPWSARRPHLWRDLAAGARETGAEWGFVVAPPFVSLLRLRGVASRRAVDFKLPDALDPGSFVSLWTIARAAALEQNSRAGLSELLVAGARFQDRVREDLQDGVEAALADIGRALQTADRTSVFDQSLTIVYRVLFLLFAEARHLVPCDHPVYREGYSVTTLVHDALEDRHPYGAWEALAAITRLSREGCRVDDLVVHPFNGRLFAKRAAPALEARPRRHRRSADELCDRAMRRALVALGSRAGSGGREEIAYADLGVEQLGAVYERVLDLPAEMPPAGVDAERAPHSARARVPRGRRSSHSQRRKETGTFYTPQPLAELVVRHTLAPLVADQPPHAILALRVLDPAMGSGAFLVAACHYLAAAYERALIAAGDASEDDFDEREQARIRRLVAERCVAGVDLNPVAVQVARLSLWLSTLADGAPLTFLDHRLRVGNSLIGARPDDLVRFDRTRPVIRPQPLFDVVALDYSIRQAVRPLIGLVDRPADTLANVRAKERTWEWLGAPTSPLAPWRVASDVWCARWCGAPGVSRWSSQEVAALVAAVLRYDTTLPAEIVRRRLSDVSALAAAQRFFHWPLEFTDAFYDADGLPRERPGFDAVIGNPPWEMVRRDDGRDGARAHDALASFVKQSGVYSLSGRGHLNLYQPFVERALLLCRDGGRLGLVLPWGALVDDGSTAMRRRLIEGGLVDAIVGFDNARGFFPIHRGMRFAMVFCARSGARSGARARFGIRTAEEIESLTDASGESGAEWPIRLTPFSVRKIGGETYRVPDVRCPDHLALVERWMDVLPRLGSDTGWGARFGRELNASDDRRSFASAGLPVLEGKHLEPFRVHAAAARHHIDSDDARRLLPDARFMQRRLGYRDVSSVTNSRSLIAAVIPAGVVTTHTIFCLRTPIGEEQNDFLCGVLNSFVVNLIVRLLMGGHVTTSLVEQLPVPRWDGTRPHRRIAHLARRLARGGTSERIWSRLEAEVAAVYRVDTAAFGSIVETFPLVPKTLRNRAVNALRQIGARATGS